MRFSFEHSGIGNSENDSLAEKNSLYISRLSAIAGSMEYLEAESSLCLPSDGSILAQVTSLCHEKIKKPIKFVVVVGIGGSNLGAKAVYDAIWGYKDELGDALRPRIVFFDTDDERTSKSSIDLILKNVSSVEDFLVVVVSKSGQTIESIAQAEYVLRALQDVFKSIDDRAVVVTKEGSPLIIPAKDRGMSIATVPEKVGGRYSVFSPVGLMPLLASGFNVNEFIAGALDMRAKCLSVDYKDNPAIMSANFLFHWYGLGKNIHDGFYFAKELESLGKWYRQLLAESIGKSGKIGITPTVSIGSSDLHSVAQLSLDGPKDKTTLFVTVKAGNSIGVSKDRIFPNVDPAISGKSFGAIEDSIFSAVKVVYQRNGLPFTEVMFDSISEREMGEFMMWKMIEIMYLAQLFKVDAFDQPGVESYKKEAINILEKI